LKERGAKEEKRRWRGERRWSQLCARPNNEDEILLAIFF